MDTAQWPQEIVVKPMEEIVTTNPKASSMERKMRPQKEQALNCPRCNSSNTKFCYYNNYSLSQPRYFCKTCRRYWTEGGSLRNIPVGGGSRKNKRPSSSSSPSSISVPSSSISSSLTATKKLPDLAGPTMSNNNNIIPQLQNPKNIINIIHHQDLNLGFSSSSPHDFKAINELIQVPNFENNTKDLLQNNPCSNFMTSSSSGFCLPSLNFSLDHHGSGSSNYGSFQGEQETNGKLLFPFQGLKEIGNSGNGSAEGNSDQNGDDDHHHHQHNSSSGYWSGVIGGGSW